MLTDELIAVLRRVPAQAAQSIIAQAGKDVRRQRMERAAAMPLWWVGGPPRTDPETTEE
jgi:hypothetical protein